MRWNERKRKRKSKSKREREREKAHIHREGERVRVYGKRARNRLGEDGGPQSIDPPWRRR